MKTIWKFPLQITGEQTVSVPFGAEPLYAGLDPLGLPCLWALVNSANTDREDLTVCIAGTGGPAEGVSKAQYLNSFVQDSFVWHVFLPSY